MKKEDNGFQLERSAKGITRIRVLYVIWRDVV